MITKFTHMCVYVLDQERAKEFYTQTLGFELKADFPMGPGTRWLTVSPPQQPDLEVTLYPVVAGQGFDEETAATMKKLVAQGTFGPGVLHTNDVYATYEELKAKGVEFVKPPTKEFYGIECLFKDDSGNWFSLKQDDEQHT